jgi:hypothetical protein
VFIGTYLPTLTYELPNQEPDRCVVDEGHHKEHVTRDRHLCSNREPNADVRDVVVSDKRPTPRVGLSGYATS